MGQGSQGGSQELGVILASGGSPGPPGFDERLCSFPKAAKKSEIFILALAQPNLGKGTNEKVPYQIYLKCACVELRPGKGPEFFENIEELMAWIELGIGAWIHNGFPTNYPEE